MARIELATSSLPRKRSTPELHWRSWSGRRGSNPRPSAWKADALPTELLPHFSFLLAHCCVELRSSVGHYRKVTPPLLTHSPCTEPKQTSKSSKNLQVFRIDENSAFLNVHIGCLFRFFFFKEKARSVCVGLLVGEDGFEPPKV